MEHRFKPALAFGAAAGTLLVVVLIMLLTRQLPDNPGIVNALLPVAPATIVLIAVLLAFPRLDERERTAHMKAFAWAFLVACWVFVVYGVGQALWQWPNLNLALAGAFMLCCWGLAWLVYSRHLR